MMGHRQEPIENKRFLNNNHARTALEKDLTRSRCWRGAVSVAFRAWRR